MKFFIRRGRHGATGKAAGRLRAAGPGAALVAELEAFGRFVYDPQESPLPGGLEARMDQLYQADGESFLAALGAAASDHGGWVAYGAERMMVSIAGGDLQHPAYDVVMAQALAFLRSTGVPSSRLTGHEWSWWRQHEGASQSWLAGQPPPAAADHVITPLHRGEVRTIAQMTEDPAGNVLLFTAAEPPAQGYAVLVDGPLSDTDPSRSRTVWFTDADPRELFVRVGSALQTPPYWAHPELQRCIPLSPPG